MQIRRVEVTNFRGIRKLEWDVGGPFACLVGAGDATKTTILDAIELALWPRWYAPFDDSDFFGVKTDCAIAITVTVGDLPEELVREDRYGFHVRGWTPEGTLRDEPQEVDEHVLSIRLTVESDLEPRWVVVCDRRDDRSISHRDREALGAVRLGAGVDRHLTWTRGSVLSQMTAGTEDLGRILAEASRAARVPIREEDARALYEAARAAERTAREAGVSAGAGYTPRLDVQALSVGSGGIALHDGQVPLRRAGLGTRRLLALALQKRAVSGGAVALVDEVEFGLEPHRIRGLLEYLRCSGQGAPSGQTIVTTHSPVVIECLDVAQIRVVRSSGGTTEVLRPGVDLQPLLRRMPSAFLGRRVIVCEGKTEVGLCRALDRFWTDKGGPFAAVGIACANGGGIPNACVAANALATLRFTVAYLGDSDRDLSPSPEALEKVGIEVVIWGDRTSVEERVALDLPLAGLDDIIRLAIEERGDQSVRTALSAQMKVHVSQLEGLPSAWVRQFEEAAVRAAIGAASKKRREEGRGWFKDEDLGEKLGDVLVRHRTEMDHTDTWRRIEQLHGWVLKGG